MYIVLQMLTEAASRFKDMSYVCQSYYNFKAKTKIPAQSIPFTLTLLEKVFSKEVKLINSTLKPVRYKVIYASG